jgi:hypothetical protein
LPTAPTGWTFGTPVLNFVSGVVTVSEKSPAYVEVVVTNSISRDKGSLKITKDVTGGPESYSASFAVHVECTGDGGVYDPTIVYPTPGYVTIENIPTGNECTVTEPTLPLAPDSYLWDSPDIMGSPAMIAKDTTAMVTVANALLEVSISLDKQIRAGDNGEWVDNLMEVIIGTQLYYRFIVTNDGDVPLTGVTVSDPTLGETCIVGDLAVGESHTCGTYGPYPAAYNDSEVICNVATASGYADGILATDMDEACYAAYYWAFTPGFWKNHYYDPDKPQQNDAWQFTIYQTVDLVTDVFVWDNCAYSLSEYGLPGELNLLDALSLRGGGGKKGATQILLRTGVASLLNASFHEVAGHDIGPGGVFPYTSAEVRQMVTCALANGDRQEMLDLADHLDMINNGVDYIVWP